MDCIKRKQTKHTNKCVKRSGGLLEIVSIDILDFWTLHLFVEKISLSPLLITFFVGVISIHPMKKLKNWTPRYTLLRLKHNKIEK